MRQFLYGTWKPVSTRPPYPEIHVILYSSPWTGHLPSCITAFIQSCAKMRVFTAGNMQDTLKTLRSRAASPCFIDQLTIALFWTKAFFQLPSMIFIFKSKLKRWFEIFGQNQLRVVTALGAALEKEVGARSSPRPKGQRPGSRSFVSFAASSFNSSHPLARIMLGKVSP